MCRHLSSPAYLLKKNNLPTALRCSSCHWSPLSEKQAFPCFISPLCHCLCLLCLSLGSQTQTNLFVWSRCFIVSIRLYTEKRSGKSFIRKHTHTFIVWLRKVQSVNKFRDTCLCVLSDECPHMQLCRDTYTHTSTTTTTSRGVPKVTLIILWTHSHRSHT